MAQKNEKIISFHELYHHYAEEFGKSDILKQQKRSASDEEQNEKKKSKNIINSLKKITKILDNPLFPLFSFEPLNDVRKISNIVSKKDKNKERKKEMQKINLKTKLLMKNTFYQPFETVLQVFAYREHSFGNMLSYLKFSNDTLINIKSLEQPSGKNSEFNPFNMPIFLATLISFKKLDKKHIVSNGILLKRLTSNPGKPLIDKPLINYKKNYFQALILYKNVSLSGQINQRKLLDYMISWDSNAPTVIDYRFFLLSNDDFFKKRLMNYYNIMLDYNENMFFNDFMYIHRSYYCNENSTGFLSCRWILPINLSMFCSGSEIANFSQIHNKSDNAIITHKIDLIKLNFNFKTNEKYVKKSKEFYGYYRFVPVNHNIKLTQYDIDLENVDYTLHNLFNDQEILKEIIFIPTVDFDNKDLSVNVKNFDRSLNFATIDNPANNLKYNILMKNRQKIIDQRNKMLKELAQFNQMNDKNESERMNQLDDQINIWPSIKYSSNIKDSRNVKPMNNHDRRLIVGEILHQWSRDLIAMDIVKKYIIDSNNNDNVTNSKVNFIHEIVIKSVLLNEFDLVHLNSEYAFISKIDDYPMLPNRMQFNNLPITIDDVMYQFFLFLTACYNHVLANKRIDDIINHCNDFQCNIISILHYFPPLNVIKWLTLWLIIEDIPFYSGYDTTKADTIFNRRLLPILYQMECLPIQKSEITKLNCFDRNINNEENYIWSRSYNYNNTSFKRMSDLINHQINMGRLMTAKTMTNMMLSDANSDSHKFKIDPKRYYVFYTKDEQFSFNINDNTELFDGSFQRLIESLSYVKNDNNIGSNMYQIQNMIDFYLSCINQYNSYIPYLIIKGNDFVKIQQNGKKPLSTSITKKKAGGPYNYDIIHYNEIYDYDNQVESLDKFYLDEVVSMNPRQIKDKPAWLYTYNPNLHKLYITTKDIKSSLNRYVRPDVNQLDFVNDIIEKEYYTPEKNERIIDTCIPLINDIIDELDSLIKNDYEIDRSYLQQRIDSVLNDKIYSLIDEYAVDYLNLDISYQRNIWKQIESLDVDKLFDVNKRRNIMTRFLFIKEYMTREYEIVKDFFAIFDALKHEFSKYDENLSTLERLTYSLYTMNNFINNEMSLLSNKKEIIHKNITLKTVKRKFLYESLTNPEKIVELNNFRYLCRSFETGERFSTVMETAYPAVKVQWNLRLKNKLGVYSEPYLYNYTIIMKPVGEDLTRNIPKLMDTHIEELENEYSVYAPILNTDLIEFILSNQKCVVLYAHLKLILLKPQFPSDHPTADEFIAKKITVYPPLSFPKSKISVFGQDVLEINPDNIYERIKRFNNYLFLNQPDEFVFFTANITRYIV